MSELTRRYWDDIAGAYQKQTRISCDDFHYGPLLPGDREMRLLPRPLKDLSCLELGCGGAQNSIFLARHGARCVAIDISGQQLSHARRLAQRHGVELKLIRGALPDLPVRGTGRFGLVHSTYALPFVEDQERVVRAAASLLSPGGMFLLTTAHPLWFAEWVELDSQECGALVQDYFRPPPDRRQSRRTEGETVCRPALLSDVFSWLSDAGLVVRRLLEPAPLPVPTMTSQQIQDRIPYFSKRWLTLYPQLAAVPSVAVFAAERER